MGDDRRIPLIDALEIPWMLPPIDRLEDVDTLAMTVAELLAYTADLQDESRALRELVHASITMVAAQRDQLTRAARVIEWQRQQLREQGDQLREQAAA